MRLRFPSLLAAVAGLALTTGCLATRGQLRAVNTQQTAALDTERSARLSAEAQLAAQDSAIRSELGVVRGDVQALRAELSSMRTEFGAKISMLQDGLKFAMPVNFDYDQSNVREQDRPALERFAHIVQQYYPGSKV